MDVYYNGNGALWGHGRAKTKLTEFPVRKTFLWGKQEVFIPAVYVGRAGAVLDVCAKIPVEDMILFLKKWDRTRRLSLKTQEEYEQLEADNPGSRDFTVDMQINDTSLTCRMSSSLRWYPAEIFQIETAENSFLEDSFLAPAIEPDSRDSEEMPTAEDWQNDTIAENLMDAYDCDRKCCWHFGRLVYDWKTKPLLIPEELSLLFQAHSLPVTAEHFSTNISCGGETITAVHPVTGQEYTLTLHGVEQTRHSFAKIGKKGIVYPEYCQILSYSVSPEIDCSLFDIRDCTDGDRPRKANAPEKISGESSAIAVFMAGKNPVPERRLAVSSLHFEPVPQTRWRVVFQIKEREDKYLRFSIPHRDK